MNKHTAGPWTVEGTASNNFNGNIDIMSAEGSKTICEVWDWTEQTANAALIAAAPEMLGALKLLVAHYEGTTLNDEWAGALMAINKAENKL